MKVWLGLAAILLGSLIVAACAGHAWASPADLWRAIAGDEALRSRLLVDWRLPRVVASAFVGALLALVFTRPFKSVAGRQLDASMDLVHGFFHRTSQIAAAHVEGHAEIAGHAFAVDVVGAVADVVAVEDRGPCPRGGHADTSAEAGTGAVPK